MIYTTTLLYTTSSNACFWSNSVLHAPPRPDLTPTVNHNLTLTPITHNDGGARACVQGTRYKDVYIAAAQQQSSRQTLTSESSRHRLQHKLTFSSRVASHLSARELGVGDPVSGSPHCQVRTTYGRVGRLAGLFCVGGRLQLRRKQVFSTHIASLSCRNPYLPICNTTTKEEQKWLL